MALSVPNANRFKAKLTDANETGCAVEVEGSPKNPGPHRRFYPWSVIRLIELTEEPDEPQMHSL
jgi:hypothetical protein